MPTYIPLLHTQPPKYILYLMVYSKKHEDPDRVYKLEKDQRITLDLSSDKREQRNEDEGEMLNDIQEIDAKGYLIDLQFD